MRDFLKMSPLTLLESSPYKGLGKGNLGVLMAGAGQGKTSCLIHIAFDRLLRGEKLVHVTLKDSPDKVASYYNVIFSDLVEAGVVVREHGVMRELLEKNRIILAYLRESFDLPRLRKNLTNLIKEIDFTPDALIIDGVDFAGIGREILEGFKRIAGEFKVEVWFSALSGGDVAEANGKGIPFPCSELEALLSIIIQLISAQEGVLLRLLKDHDREVMPDTVIRLDPNTFLTLE
jgi:hypothetical protein